MVPVGGKLGQSPLATKFSIESREPHFSKNTRKPRAFTAPALLRTPPPPTPPPPPMARTAIALLVIGAALVSLPRTPRAEEAPMPPPPPPPLPVMSEACQRLTSLKSSDSMWKQKGFMDNIASAWGVLVDGPPSPLNILAPQGAGTAQYYQFASYSGYNFWKVSVGSAGGYGKDCYFLDFHRSFPAESPMYAPRNPRLIEKVSPCRPFRRRLPVRAAQHRAEKPRPD
eukprot:SAG31_NODE_8259_length_1487_cov_0.844380_2_plen_227_part_00